VPKWVVVFISVWLSGCVTYHAVPVSPGQKVKLSEDEVLIFGRFIGISNLPSKIFQDSRQPFGAGKLFLDHVSPSDTSNPSQHEKRDFFVTSLTVDNLGFFSAVVPAGEYILRRHWEESHGATSDVRFDCKVGGSACYLGTLSIEHSNSVTRINGLPFPSITVSSELPLAYQQLATIVTNLDEWPVYLSPSKRIPCSFRTIASPPRTQFPWRGKPAISDGKLAVTISQYSPNPELDVLAAGKSEAVKLGTVAGAVGGALYGAIAPISIFPWAAFFYPFFAPYTIGAGLVLGASFGAISGALGGVEDEDAKSLAVAVQKSTSGQPIQVVLGEKIANKATEVGVDATLLQQAGPRDRSETLGYSEISGAGYSSVLELSVLKAGFHVDRDGDSPLLDFGILIQVRTQGFGHTGTSESRSILLQTRVRAINDWLLDGGNPLAQNINESLDTLVQCLSEALFSPISTTYGGQGNQSSKD
jgi:hypothetical protein